MSIQPVQASLHPTQPLECKLPFGSGSVTIPVLSQETLNCAATAQIDRNPMDAQIFTLRFSNGDLRNFSIKVNDSGLADWCMPKSYKIPSDWFRFRVDFAKGVINQYLNSAQDKIEASRRAAK